MPDVADRLHQILERLGLDEFVGDGEPALRDEVAALVAAPGFDDDVTDLEELAFVTIDNPGSRDLDQALYVERADHGWTVFYAIADAAYYVRPGTALHARSLERGSTYYLPTFALPMLPEALSEGIVSLNPDVRRRAVLFESDVDVDGDILDTRLRRVRIRSRAKLTYDGVQAYFDSDSTAIEGTEYEPSLREFARVGEVLRARAAQRGMLEFDRSEAEVSVADDGEHLLFEARVRNDVERWNEQISLLCNTEGARILQEFDKSLDDLQAIYRVHLPPMARRLDELQRSLEQVARYHGLGGSWVWDGEEPLASYLAGLPDEPAAVRKAIDRQVRYTNRASEFSDRVGPHYALAVDEYARFSSPMREVVGIFTHKELLEALGLEEERPTAADDELRQAVIEAANDAKRLQKRLDKEVVLLALHDLFEADLEQPVRRQGTVIGLRATRVYVAVDDIPVDIKLYIEDFEERFGCEFQLGGTVLRSADAPAAGPAFSLGDRISFEVSHFDEGQRRWRFHIAPET